MTIAARALWATAWGLLFGSFAVACNSSSVPALHTLSYFTGGIDGWCVAGVVAGLLMKRPLWGPMGGMIALPAAIFSYYTTDSLRGVYGDITHLHWDWLAGDLQAWLPLSLAAGIVFGSLGGAIRAGGIMGSCAGLLLPAYVLWSHRDFLLPPYGRGLVGPSFGAEHGLPDHAALLSIWMEIGLAALAAAYFVTRLGRRLAADRGSEGQVPHLDGVPSLDRAPDQESELATGHTDSPQRPG